LNFYWSKFCDVISSIYNLVNRLTYVFFNIIIAIKIEVNKIIELRKNDVYISSKSTNNNNYKVQQIHVL